MIDDDDSSSFSSSYVFLDIDDTGAKRASEFSKIMGEIKFP